MSKRDEIVEIALSQKGYKEGPNNDTKYGAWYGLNYNPWCAMFVSWCADQIGILNTLIPKFAGCTTGFRLMTDMSITTKEHIIPRKKELERIEEATRNIPNLPLDVTKPYEEVNHPDHYNVYDVEVVEMMERIFGIEETMSWCKLNAFKYRMRAGEKPTSTVEKDLKKEKWCLNKYKELKSKK